MPANRTLSLLSPDRSGSYLGLLRPTGIRGVSASRCRSAKLLHASFWVVRALRVDIEIDYFDAALGCYVTGPGMPRPRVEFDIAHLKQPKEVRLTFGREGR